MILNSQNSTNPLFWGKDLKLVLDGKVVEPYSGIQFEDMPSEFDFFNVFCGKDPINAKEYYYGR